MRRVAFGRIRQQSLEYFQQLLHARTCFGRGEANRYEVALSQGLLKRVVELLRRELLALLQIQRHELLIDLDDLIDDLRVRGRNRGEVDGTGVGAGPIPRSMRAI